MRTSPIPAAYHVFNQLTSEGADMGAYSDLLNEAISSLIDVTEERDIDSLFSGTKTTALQQTLRGPRRLRADRLPRHRRARGRPMTEPDPVARDGDRSTASSRRSACTPRRSAGAALKQRFVDEVQRIRWAYKIGEESLRLAPGETVAEIQVFVVDLKGSESRQLRAGLHRQGDPSPDHLRAAPRGPAVWTEQAGRRLQARRRQDQGAADYFRSGWIGG